MHILAMILLLIILAVIMSFLVILAIVKKRQRETKIRTYYNDKQTSTDNNRIKSKDPTLEKRMDAMKKKLSKSGNSINKESFKIAEDGTIIRD